jgi:hypothetical protein
MRILIPILTFLFIAVSCKNKNKLPAGILPQKKMQVVLTDLMRADQFLSNYILNKDTSLNKISESLKYYQQVFALHKITRDEFQHSFSFYKSHPVLFKTILDSISNPPKEAPTQLAVPVKTVDTVSAIPDTTNSGIKMNRPDTLVPGRKKKSIKLRLID